METFDSTSDILEFALTKEVKAREFYQNVAEQVASLDMGNIFERLAQEESQHIAKIQLEIMKIGKVVPGIEDISALDDTLVMVPLEPEVEDVYREAFILAINKEKASLRRYIDFAIQVEDEELREVLAELAEEETRHKVLLELEYDQFVKQSH